MIRNKINSELAYRSWSVRRLADETGIRHASLTEYLSNKKELSSKNLEKVFKTLGIMQDINIKQWTSNGLNNLDTLKNVLSDSKIEENVLMLNPEHFRDFEWLLTSVSNPFNNADNEAREFLMNYIKENNLKQAGFKNIPYWAK